MCLAVAWLRRLAAELPNVGCLTPANPAACVLHLWQLCPCTVAATVLPGRPKHGDPMVLLPSPGNTIVRRLLLYAHLHARVMYKVDTHALHMVWTDAIEMLRLKSG